MNKLIKHSKKNLFVLVLAFVIIFSIPKISMALSVIEKQVSLIGEVYEIISMYHVQKIDHDELTKGAINGMIETLDDPYTTYFTDEEYQSFINNLDASFTGIGVYIEELDGYIMVQAPIKGSPAEEAGLLTGDLIVEVNGVDIKEKSHEESVNLIKGKEGTSVLLTINRDGQIIKKEVKRAKIQLPVVESEMLENKVGYIKLNTFSNQSGAEFKAHLNKLKADGMEKLVVDLRGNPGGYLDAAIDISKNFIMEGPIVHVKNRVQREQTYSVSNGTDLDIPIAVLMNRGSASASEILAGALKDYDKAVIVGENSFGKGTVQRLITLENGGHLKLTMEEYFTPNHNKMNGVGVKPDIDIAQPDQQLPAAIQALSGTEVKDTRVFNAQLGTDWLKQKNGDYIALRPFVEAFGGLITYQGKDNSLRIILDGTETNISLDDETVIVDKGRSYIEWNQLKNKFNQFMFIMDDEKITIYDL